MSGRVIGNPCKWQKWHGYNYCVNPIACIYVFLVQIGRFLWELLENMPFTASLYLFWCVFGVNIGKKWHFFPQKIGTRIEHVHKCPYTVVEFGPNGKFYFLYMAECVFAENERIILNNNGTGAI